MNHLPELPGCCCYCGGEGMSLGATWSGGFAEWTEGNTAFLSVPFTWELQNAHQRAVWLKAAGYHVRAGGPAVSLMPEYLTDVAEIGGEVNALPHHNPNATFTSRGCIRRCPFCAVWRVEGELRELAEWEPKPIVCDNNLLACSMAHFDRVIDRLKPLAGIDFNQGLDARLLTKHHAGRLAELDCMVRLAWDHIDYGNDFMQAYERLRKAGIPKSRIRVYVLIGYKDKPEDALFRLRTVHNMGIKPNPMRYNPLDSLTRDAYVGEHWSDRLLIAYMRYWANLRFTESVPFSEWLEREIG
jgi:hypothetical protein